MLFQFTLTISLDYDSMTGDESASQLSLQSGESLFTDNLLTMYKNTFNSMLENFIDKFDVLRNYQESTCRLSYEQPNVVILKPGKTPN